MMEYLIFEDTADFDIEKSRIIFFNLFFVASYEKVGEDLLGIRKLNDIRLLLLQL